MLISCTAAHACFPLLNQYVSIFSFYIAQNAMYMYLTRAIRLGVYLDKTLKNGRGSSVISDDAWGLRNILFKFDHKKISIWSFFLFRTAKELTLSTGNFPLGGLSIISIKINDRSDMTSSVYRGRIAIIKQTKIHENRYCGTAAHITPDF